ncbi:MAG TPA: class I SAM-dependent methyltransferase [Polyangiaceae bacterium]|nr:class I SAM-dependent methyltransferase [Polyangiaceae bacterium]
MRGKFQIWRCEPCDLEFVHPTPTPADLSELYQSGYFCGPGAGYGDYFGAERRSNLRKAAHRLDVLQKLGLTSGSRILDVGCADGTFVEAACARGYDAYGIEVSVEALSGVGVSTRARVAPSHEAAAIWAPFDCITFWDVLEHLPDPWTALGKALEQLSAGGLVGVVVPVIENFNARRWPTSWDQYKPPEHLWYFSRKSLRSLLEVTIGDVLWVENAWRRDSRLFEVAFDKYERLGAPLAFLERLLVRAFVGARLVPLAAVEDSVAMFARRRAALASTDDNPSFRASYIPPRIP